ncbi:hypothetical protein [Nostoc sp.]|uniref:hypothetical protein n=1 Tax=Nostoc sp. TaxID=1180 RepID=UPI002FFA02C0
MRKNAVATLGLTKNLHGYGITIPIAQNKYSNQDCRQLEGETSVSQQYISALTLTATVLDSKTPSQSQLGGNLKRFNFKSICGYIPQAIIQYN